MLLARLDVCLVRILIASARGSWWRVERRFKAPVKLVITVDALFVVVADFFSSFQNLI